MLIDTNVYIAAAQGNQQAADILQAATEIIVPAMVIAELRYGFLAGNQTDKNNQLLDKFLSQPQVDIALPTISTINIYAELAAYCRSKGRALSHNDLWIAALAKELGLQFATFDQDFTILKTILRDKLLLLDQ